MKREFAAKVYHLWPCHRLGCHILYHTIYLSCKKGKSQTIRNGKSLAKTTAPIPLPTAFIYGSLLNLVPLPLHLRPICGALCGNSYWMSRLLIPLICSPSPYELRKKSLILFLCVSSQCSFVFPSPPSVIALWCHYNFAAQRNFAYSLSGERVRF